MEHRSRELLERVAPYPPGVKAVPAIIRGTAFFPGGRGLWMEGVPDPTFANKKIMVLGHDFHSETGYQASRDRGHEDLNDPTWRELRKLFTSAIPGVSLTDVFFTNFYMGLREGNKPTGRFPGASDKAFVARCGTFFLEQVRLQRPRLILTLGTQVPSLIAVYSEQLIGWRGKRTLSAIDAAGPLQQGVRFDNSEHECVVAAMTHPSLRNSNVRHRKYAGLEGGPAEHRLLLDALSSTR